MTGFIKNVLFAAIVGMQSLAAVAALDVRTVGLKGDGVTDDTAALNAALSRGVRELEFCKGVYLIGTVTVPGGSTLRFSKDASVRISPDGIVEADEGERPLFHITGNAVSIDGLTADEVMTARVKIGRKESPAVTSVIHARGRKNLRISGFRSRNREERGKSNPAGAHLVQCSDIEFSDGEFSGLSFCCMMIDCVNASVHGNRAENCNTITSFTRGSEGLRHYDNWSRNVIYQCVFRGGLPDPSRKAPRIPLGSSKVVIRDLDMNNATSGYYKSELAKAGASGVVLDDKTTGAEQWHTALSGAYDIQIVNNYAEYGRTLAWGNRGRDVIFAGNVSRFMTDYSYGVEGCENVVFANNISINARSVGIMSMYWGDKLVLSGNMVIVRDEPYRQEYSWMKDQSGYWGGFFRFHHGPGKKDDYDAGSDYGGGHAIVSGNLFINELTDRVRGVSLESGRDVTVCGNKFVNGVIRKGGKGSVTISGNEFISHIPVEHSFVVVGGTDMTIADNMMRFIGDGKRMAFREIAADGTDEAQNAAEDEKLAEKLPAIAMGFRKAADFKRLIVKGNTITGWSKDAVRFECPSRPVGGAPIDVLIRDNNVEGAVRLVGADEDVRFLSLGNVDLRGFSALKVIREAAHAAPVKK